MTVVPIATAKARPDVIKAVRDLLDLCESGQVIAIAFATQHADGSIGTAYTLGGDADVFRLMGATQHVLCRLSKKADE